jgi:hypothetical protein
MVLTGLLYRATQTPQTTLATLSDLLIGILNTLIVSFRISSSFPLPGYRELRDSYPSENIIGFESRWPESVSETYSKLTLGDFPLAYGDWSAKLVRARLPQYKCRLSEKESHYAIDGYSYRCQAHTRNSAYSTATLVPASETPHATRESESRFPDWYNIFIWFLALSKEVFADERNLGGQWLVKCDTR